MARVDGMGGEFPGEEGELEGQHGGEGVEAETFLEPLLVPPVVGECGELDGNLSGGVVPELADVLVDIGDDSVEARGSEAVRETPKFYRSGG